MRKFFTLLGVSLVLLACEKQDVIALETKINKVEINGKVYTYRLIGNSTNNTYTSDKSADAKFVESYLEERGIRGEEVVYDLKGKDTLVIMTQDELHEKISNFKKQHSTRISNTDAIYPLPVQNSLTVYTGKMKNNVYTLERGYMYNRNIDINNPGPADEFLNSQQNKLNGALMDSEDFTLRTKGAVGAFEYEGTLASGSKLDGDCYFYARFYQGKNFNGKYLYFAHFPMRDKTDTKIESGIIYFNSFMTYDFQKNVYSSWEDKVYSGKLLVWNNDKWFN